MRGPKQEGAYPDRDIDCQEDLAEAFDDRFDRGILIGQHPRGAGMRGRLKEPQDNWNDIIADAVAAGWSEQESRTALLIVIDGMREGEAGTNPQE